MNRPIKVGDKVVLNPAFATQQELVEGKKYPVLEIRPRPASLFVDPSADEVLEGSPEVFWYFVGENEGEAVWADLSEISQVVDHE